MNEPRNNYTVEPFNGDQATADAIAAYHLAVRFQQRADGESDFQGRIHSSQADLKNMAVNYIEPGGNFFIARDETGAITGFVGLKKIGETEGEIKRMAVMPPYRRQGIGMQLAETAVTWAREAGFERLRVATGRRENAIHIYKAVGFVLLNETNEHNDHMMVLDLG